MKTLDNKQIELDQAKAEGEAPQWMTVESYDTITKGIILAGESPRQAYQRVSDSTAKYLDMPEYANAFFDLMWDNILGPATPELSNSGTNRGSVISCFGVEPSDDVYSISGKIQEVAMLSKIGGGVAQGYSKIRPQGAPIQNGANGRSDGVVGFIKMFDSTIVGISQGGTRRGAGSANLDITHADWPEFLRIRRGGGDVNRQCPSIHHCGWVSDEVMRGVGLGDYESRTLWFDLLHTRFETGEPYIAFTDTINRANPQAYKNHGLEVSMTNICSEIVLHTDPEHSFICCLASLNLLKIDQFKDRDAVYLGTLFLNGVLNEFIEKHRGVPGFEPTVASAIKGRAIGLGVMGWHYLLQTRSIPFDSFEAMQLNNSIFKNMKSEALRASQFLAKKLGEPEWCVGTGLYNTHLLAVAPTKTNSHISCAGSEGIEPFYANLYVTGLSKGEYYLENKLLFNMLSERGKDTPAVRKAILRADGSVQGLEGCLSDHEKKVYLTAHEISQKSIIRQAAQRQKYICQSQSLNLFPSGDVDPAYFREVHYMAWKAGVKTLYYCKGESGIRVGAVDRNDECPACES